VNNNFLVLKIQYDEISKEIRFLQEKQNEIRFKMKEECTHENVILIENNLNFDEEEIETKYKCKDCFEYFRSKK
jgi:hypothetical protein